VPKALEAASSAKVRTSTLLSSFLLNSAVGIVTLDKKWTVLAMGSVTHFLQQGSLLVALSQLSTTRYVRVSPPPPSFPRFVVARVNPFLDPCW
jgi:hypothetical protein